MGGIGGMFGLSGGQSGTGLAGPEQATIQTGVGTEQTAHSYDQNQTALAQQQGAVKQQQDLLNALQQQGGMQKQQDVYGQLQGAYGQNQGLYGQLQGVANGTGPNPAMAMLNQQTGQNVQNQAALMAGQRGAGANSGLIARQAAQQGANTQQQAVGQGATMQAQQSLNALGQAGGVLGQGANILGQAGNIGNTQVANQIGAQNAYGSAAGAYTAANQAEQANLLNALSARNTAQVGSQSSVNSANAGLANTQLQGQQAVVGGLMNVMGGGAMSKGGANGGVVVKGYDDGGEVTPPAPDSNAPDMNPKGAGPAGIPLQSAQNIAPTGMGPSGIPLQSVTNSSPPPIPASSFGQFTSKVDAGAPAQQAQAFVSGPNPGAEALYKGVSSMGQGAKSMMGGMGGGGGEGGGSSMMSMAPMLMAAMSDKKAKTNIKSGDKPTEEFLNNIQAHEYNYKKSAGQDSAKHVSPMAQELEKSTTGKQMVSESPGGKMVDYSKSGPAILASLAFLQKEIKSLKEGKSYSGGGLVDVVVSPGEKIVMPEKVGKAAGGKVEAKTVPGTAKVAGDSQKNDIVRARLPEGAIVVPRTKSKNKTDSASFVRMTLAKRGRK